LKEGTHLVIVLEELTELVRSTKISHSQNQVTGGIVGRVGPVMPEHWSKRCCREKEN
jgi:hypothetical protein